MLYILRYLKGSEALNLYHLVQAERAIGYLAGRVTQNAGLSQGAMKHDLPAVTTVAQFQLQQPGPNAPCITGLVRSGLVRSSCIPFMLQSTLRQACIHAACQITNDPLSLHQMVQVGVLNSLVTFVSFGTRSQTE